MPELNKSNPGKKRSVRALEGANFFLADVQTGLGPFLAAYLAASGWNPERVGMVLTFGGILPILLQTPAGAVVDRAPAKRLVLSAGTLVLAAGAILLSMTAKPWVVYTAQVLIGGAGPFLGPTLAAITMGLVGVKLFDRQFGKNQSFNSAGNIASALLIAGVSRFCGNKAIFITAALLTIPTMAAILLVRGGDIDNQLARGGSAAGAERQGPKAESMIALLRRDRVLLLFILCAFFFHFANAAMLPQLGEMLSRGSATSAAPFMSACIIVTQLVIAASASTIGRLANLWGRKPLLLLGFGVLPLRAVLYTLIHNPGGLIAVQLLDGVANAVFVVVSILVVADRTRGSGRFNLVQGALATAVGTGAALSNAFGGRMIQHDSFRISFLALGVVAVIAFALLFFFVPETLVPNGTTTPASPLAQEASA